MLCNRCGTALGKDSTSCVVCGTDIPTDNSGGEECHPETEQQPSGKGGKSVAVAWLILSQFAAIVTAFFVAMFASDLANFISRPGEADGFIATMTLIITIVIVVSWVLFGRGMYGLACLASSIPLLLLLFFIG